MKPNGRQLLYDLSAVTSVKSGSMRVAYHSPFAHRLNTLLTELQSVFAHYPLGSGQPVRVERMNVMRKANGFWMEVAFDAAEEEPMLAMATSDMIDVMGTLRREGLASHANVLDLKRLVYPMRARTP